MKYFVSVFFLLIVSISTQSQNLKLEDYERAVSYRPANLQNKTVFNTQTSVNWFKDDTALWFIDHSPEGKSYKTIDLNRFMVKPLFDSRKLGQAFEKILGHPVDAKHLSVKNIAYEDANMLSFDAFGTSYLLNLKTYSLTVRKKPISDINPFESLSPDGKWTAYTENYNLYIKSVETGEVHQLSADGKKDYEYGTYYGWYDLMEGENGERPKRFFAHWSPDSQWLFTKRIDLTQAEKMYLLDWSIDSLYKPKLLSYYRGSPGDTTLVSEKPVFYNVNTKKEVITSFPEFTHLNRFSIKWLEASGVLIADYIERGYKRAYVKQIDLNSNKEELLITETSATNIDNFHYQKLDGKDKLLFLSERSGWRQLYSLDLKTRTIKALTNGDFYVNEIKYVDFFTGDIFFLASGREPENNPYHQQLYKVDLNGKLTLLTPENLHHEVSFSKGGKYFVDNYSSVNTPTKTVLRLSRTGKILAQLTEAEISQVVAKGWQAPETFELIAKDHKTTIYGALWKPSHFEASKSYPLIDATYTGPHTQRFPKSFSQAFSNQALAELGFIVMQVDGLGTSGRSKAFHDHSYKNMQNNLEDHVLAIRYLGEKYQWIDTDRVGIFGHSAGGYDTGRAMLGFPEVYKVGVASAGDHDFRMEKVWWPEMYQGWPVDETYEQVSNITNAKNLKGKLLLVHGGIDDNVNPSATFKLAEALVNADKEFDMLILPSQRHGFTGKSQRYFIKRQWNYFVEHLLGQKPIWNFNLE